MHLLAETTDDRATPLRGRHARIAPAAVVKMIDTRRRFPWRDEFLVREDLLAWPHDDAPTVEEAESLRSLVLRALVSFEVQQVATGISAPAVPPRDFLGLDRSRGLAILEQFSLIGLARASVGAVQSSLRASLVDTLRILAHVEAAIQEAAAEAQPPAAPPPRVRTKTSKLARPRRRSPPNEWPEATEAPYRPLYEQLADGVSNLDPDEAPVFNVEVPFEPYYDRHPGQANQRTLHRPRPKTELLTPAQRADLAHLVDQPWTRRATRNDVRVPFLLEDDSAPDVSLGDWLAEQGDRARAAWNVKYVLATAMAADRMTVAEEISAVAYAAATHQPGERIRHWRSTAELSRESRRLRRRAPIAQVLLLRFAYSSARAPTAETVVDRHGSLNAETVDLILDVLSRVVRSLSIALPATWRAIAAAGADASSDELLPLLGDGLSLAAARDWLDFVGTDGPS